VISESDFYGVAADFDELRTIESRVRPGDLAGYVRAWTDVAGDLEQKAGRLVAAGRSISAHDLYLRASNYYHRAQGGFLRAGDGVRIVEPYLKMRQAWAHAWKLAPTPFEPIDLRFADTTLPALFFHADRCAPRTKRPVVIVLGGSDHVIERSYFRFEPEDFVTRGVSFLTLDGPGQGEPLNLRRVFLRPDYEHVVGAAIDYLATRSDVDATRIGVYGQAFSGFFAARAALDSRVRAVACRSASFDMLTECYDFSTAFRRQFEYLLGVTGENAARSALRAYNLADAVGRIRVPIAIYHGGRDDVQDPAGARRLFDAVRHSDKLLKIVPDAGRSVGREAEVELTDWLIARLT
jgi:dipeptidyl aminopeptidase/acylaminoacyl peptidase